jgi:hypothetical protein
VGFAWCADTNESYSVPAACGVGYTCGLGSRKHDEKCNEFEYNVMSHTTWLYKHQVWVFQQRVRLQVEDRISELLEVVGVAVYARITEYRSQDLILILGWDKNFSLHISGILKFQSCQRYC